MKFSLPKNIENHCNDIPLPFEVCVFVDGLWFWEIGLWRNSFCMETHKFLGEYTPARENGVFQCEVFLEAQEFLSIISWWSVESSYEEDTDPDNLGLFICRDNWLFSCCGHNC